MKDKYLFLKNDEVISEHDCAFDAHDAMGKELYNADFDGVSPQMFHAIHHNGVRYYVEARWVKSHD